MLNRFQLAGALGGRRQSRAFDKWGETLINNQLDTATVTQHCFTGLFDRRFKTSYKRINGNSNGLDSFLIAFNSVFPISFSPSNSVAWSCQKVLFFCKRTFGILLSCVVKKTLFACASSRFIRSSTRQLMKRTIRFSSHLANFSLLPSFKRKTAPVGQGCKTLRTDRSIPALVPRVIFWVEFCTSSLLCAFFAQKTLNQPIQATKTKKALDRKRPKRL